VKRRLHVSIVLLLTLALMAAGGVVWAQQPDPPATTLARGQEVQTQSETGPLSTEAGQWQQLLGVGQDNYRVQRRTNPSKPWRNKLVVNGAGRLTVWGQQILFPGGKGKLVAGTPAGNGPGWLFFAPNGHRRDVYAWNEGLAFAAGSGTSLAPVGSRLFLLENGNVGIGRYPGGKLDIDFGSTGILRAGTPLGSGPGWMFYAPNGHRRDFLASNWGFNLCASSTAGACNQNTFAVNESGNVGIGTGAAGNILTVVRNSPTDPVADDWTTYSSQAYKQDVRELTPQEYQQALQALLDTRVVRYRYVGQGAQAKEKIGVIAEEVPELILAENDPNAVSLKEYVSTLHAAIKAQQAQIDAQQQLLATQQAQIDQLQAQVEQLLQASDGN